MARILFKLSIYILLVCTLSANAQQVVDSKDLSDGWHRVQLEGGMFYDGEILLGKIDGKGTMTWPDSSNYSGIWKTNMRHGKGTMKWNNGNYYTGHFKMDEIYGKGTFVFGDGRKYIGKFKDGKFHGKGMLIYKDGKVEKGKWEDGNRINNNE